MESKELVFWSWVSICVQQNHRLLHEQIKNQAKKANQKTQRVKKAEKKIKLNLNDFLSESLISFKQNL